MSNETNLDEDLFPYPNDEYLPVPEYSVQPSVNMELMNLAEDMYEFCLQAKTAFDDSANIVEGDFKGRLTEIQEQAKKPVVSAVEHERERLRATFEEQYDEDAFDYGTFQFILSVINGEEQFDE